MDKKYAKHESKLPRTVKTQMVKDRILQTTSRLIREKGYACVTVSTICKTAGVSVGSFYHHFNSKDNLLSFYLREAYESKAQEFTEIQGNNIVQNLQKSYALYNQFLLTQGQDFIKNFYVSDNKALFTYNNQAGAKIEAPIVAQNESLIQEAIHHGYIREDVSPAHICNLLATLEKGSIFDWCLCDGSYSLVDKTGELIQDVLRGYVTEQYLHEFPETYQELTRILLPGSQ